MGWVRARTAAATASTGSSVALGPRSTRSRGARSTPAGADSDPGSAQDPDRDVHVDHDPEHVDEGRDERSRGDGGIEAETLHEQRQARADDGAEGHAGDEGQAHRPRHAVMAAVADEERAQEADTAQDAPEHDAHAQLAPEDLQGVARAELLEGEAADDERGGLAARVAPRRDDEGDEDLDGLERSTRRLIVLEDAGRKDLR